MFGIIHWLGLLRYIVYHSVLKYLKSALPGDVRYHKYHAVLSAMKSLLIPFK